MAKHSQLDKAIDVFDKQRDEHLRHAEILADIIEELRGYRSPKAAKPRTRKPSPATRAMNEPEKV